MVAKISSNTSLFGTLLYNKNKIEKEEAKLLSSRNVYQKGNNLFDMRTTMKSFESYLIVNKRTEKPIFHVSLNPSPKDNLTDEQYQEIADKYMEEMGYNNQPYVVFKHTDISRTHLHIVSVRVDENGKKLDSNFEHIRSMKICRQLEKDFNLHPATKQEQQQGYTPLTQPLNYKQGNIKQQISNITKAIMDNYSFQSVGEYRTLLEMFNVTVEELKGQNNGNPYQGLLYSPINENKKKVGIPIKASKVGKSVGYNTLQKKFIQSKVSVEKKKIKESLKPIISQAISKSQSLDELKTLLLANNIGLISRKNEQGRLYGVSFIDYQNKAILNGSRLGKEFLANALHDFFIAKKSNLNNSSQYQQNKSTENLAQAKNEESKQKSRGRKL